jgi:carbon-monoxide dehydrogenase medium subunit
MKPVDFRYERPRTLAEALQVLASEVDAKIMAGGQTLGPMLNLRLAQPEIVVDITRIADLAGVEQTADAVTYGATVTHAAVEDGRVPDPTRGLMARVAHGIGYRAVRVRGTIGGSLVHADPAADWVTCLSVLGAEVVVAGLAGSRRIPMAGFMRRALDAALEPGEILTAVRVPRPSASARFGYAKFCRKEGEFADAIGAAMIDPERGIHRLVASTPAGAPQIITRPGPIAPDEIPALLDEKPAGDAYEQRLRHVTLKRALQEASAP